MCRAAVALLVLLLSSTLAMAQVEAQWVIGPYTVTIDHRGDAPIESQSVLTVFRGGKRLHAMTNGTFDVNPVVSFVEQRPGTDYAETIKPHRVGEDVLGLGAPTLMVRGFTRGAHCCFDLTVLVLGKTFHAMPTIPLYDAAQIQVRPVHGRHTLAIDTEDFVFAYWWSGGFVLSASAPVVLGYDARMQRYAADPMLMRKPPLPASELGARQAAVRDEHAAIARRTNWVVPYLMTSTVLELIYTGHLPAARAFLDRAWAGPPEVREEYWSDLTTCQLRVSQFWPAVAALNGLRADPPIGECPRPRKE